MEMHQVRYFLALCEEQSFTRAARRCGVAQPSLSRAIKQLEAELGGSLFDRNRTNTRLTDLAILLRPDLALINRTAEEAERNARKFLVRRSVTRQPTAMEVFMRAHHVIAVVAVLIIGLGAKQYVFPPIKAEADLHTVPSASMNVLQMQREIDTKSLSVQKMNDKTFIFTDED